MSQSPPEHGPVLEDLEFLVETGVGLTEAAERTGFTDRNHLDKWLRRHGREDLLGPLLRRDRRSVAPSQKAY